MAIHYYKTIKAYQITTNNSTMSSLPLHTKSRTKIMARRDGTPLISNLSNINLLFSIMLNLKILSFREPQWLIITKSLMAYCCSVRFWEWYKIVALLGMIVDNVSTLLIPTTSVLHIKWRCLMYCTKGLNEMLSGTTFTPSICILKTKLKKHWILGMTDLSVC